MAVLEDSGPAATAGGRPEDTAAPVAHPSSRQQSTVGSESIFSDQPTILGSPALVSASIEAPGAAPQVDDSSFGALDETVPLGIQTGGDVESRSVPVTAGQPVSVQYGSNVLAELCAQQAARIAELERQFELQRLAAAKEREAQLMQELREVSESVRADCDAKCERMASMQALLRAENQELFAEVRSLRCEVLAMKVPRIVPPGLPSSSSRSGPSITVPAGNGSSTGWASSSMGSLMPRSASALSVGSGPAVRRAAPPQVSAGLRSVEARTVGIASTGGRSQSARGVSALSPAMVRHPAVRGNSPARFAAPPPQTQQPGPAARQSSSLSPRSREGGAPSPRGQSPIPGVVSATRRLLTPQGSALAQQGVRVRS